VNARAGPQRAPHTGRPNEALAALRDRHINGKALPTL
jgi:hypothetical protein